LRAALALPPIVALETRFVRLATVVVTTLALLFFFAHGSYSCKWGGAGDVRLTSPASSDGLPKLGAIMALHC
jgi:hypothetical protein